ncbi:hypothetical protein D3C79_1003280 [compost metagenome]
MRLKTAQLRFPLQALLLLYLSNETGNSYQHFVEAASQHTDFVLASSCNSDVHIAFLYFAHEGSQLGYRAGYRVRQIVGSRYTEHTDNKNKGN